MKVVVRSDSKWKKVVFNVPDDVFNEIEKNAEEYGFRMDEVLKIILIDGYVEGDVKKEELKELEEEIKTLEKLLYQLEGKWSPLKFKTYYIALDNQNLAIQLSGMLAENKRLRKQLGLPLVNRKELEELIHYYMGFNK